MSLVQFSEVVETEIKRFAECPLGKQAENNVLDKPISEYDKSLAVIRDNMKNCPIDNGHWDGERGNSNWQPDSNYIPGKANPDGKTWSEILDKYGIDRIPFKDGEPDFSEICKGTVEIKQFADSRTDNFDKADIELAKQKNGTSEDVVKWRKDNFDKADIELTKQKGCTPEDVANWRKENCYTWHECKDMKTMQKVPSEVHNNITHSGGISEAKKRNDDIV